MSEQDNKMNQTEVVQEAFSAEDIEKNKTMAGLAYFIFFLPLIVCPDSAYAKFHANQGLILLIVALGGGFILGVTVIGTILIPLLSLAVFVFQIMGLINGLQGKAKELPIIGKYRIIK